MALPLPRIMMECYWVMRTLEIFLISPIEVCWKLKQKWSRSVASKYSSLTALLHLWSLNNFQAIVIKFNNRVNWIPQCEKSLYERWFCHHCLSVIRTSDSNRTTPLDIIQYKLSLHHRTEACKVADRSILGLRNLIATSNPCSSPQTRQLATDRPSHISALNSPRNSTFSSSDRILT